MTIIVDINDQILPLLKKMESQLVDIATDIANLKTAVSDVSTDVAQVLTLISQAPNITPDQVTTLEAQIAALQQLDATVKAAIPTPPTPPPGP